MCRLADAVIAVSPEDADALRGFRDDGVVHIVSSGIFVEDYHNPTPSPSPYHREGELASTLSTQHYSLVFTGKMDYRPNVDAMLWFADEILPLIQREISDIRLIIVGQQPHTRLDALRQNPAVTLTGWVDSVLPYLHEAAVYVAPLRMGSGTRLKLLEAMAMGCAIVATNIAAAGLTDEVKRARCIADEAESFAQAVVDLLRDAPRRDMMGDEARHAIRVHYDWSAIMPRLFAVYDTLTPKDSPRG
jgi:glycosyltransferase involved in cell wall biosynthesis